MEEKKLSDPEKLRYDWRKLALAEIADDYINQGNEEGNDLAKKSLELILQDKDIGGIDPTIKTMTDPRVIRISIENYLETYKEGYEDQTIGEIVNYNENI